MSEHDKTNNELLAQMTTALERISGWLTGASAHTIARTVEPSPEELEYRAAALAHMETTQLQQDAIARSMADIADALRQLAQKERDRG